MWQKKKKQTKKTTVAMHFLLQCRNLEKLYNYSNDVTICKYILKLCACNYLLKYLTSPTEKLI